jgi:hypothetical protein
LITVQHNGHTIQVQREGLGNETISYDGRVVSNKRTLNGTNHDFSIVEGGEQISYQVTIGIPLVGKVQVTIRRNGQVIYSQR